jgi:hypothetical protein
MSGRYPPRLSLAEKHLRFSQLADDLFDGVAFSRHFDLSPYADPNIKIGLVLGGQVKANNNPHMSHLLSKNQKSPPRKRRANE